MTEKTTAAETRSFRRRVSGHPLAHLLVALLLLGLTQTFVVKLFMVPSGSMQQTMEIGDRILVNRLAYGLPGEHLTPAAGDVIVFTADDELWPRSPDADAQSISEALKHGIKTVFGDFLGIGPTSEHTLVKRVIATPGQTVACCSAQGTLLVNGQELSEPYIFEDLSFTPAIRDCATVPISTRCFSSVTVPDGMLLVLGDHRSNSSDGISLCRGTTSDQGSSCARWVKIDDVLGQAFGIVWPIQRIGAIP